MRRPCKFKNSSSTGSKPQTWTNLLCPWCSTPIVIAWVHPFPTMWHMLSTRLGMSLLISQVSSPLQLTGSTTALVWKECKPDMSSYCASWDRWLVWKDVMVLLIVVRNTWQFWGIYFHKHFILFSTFACFGVGRTPQFCKHSSKTSRIKTKTFKHENQAQFLSFWDLAQPQGWARYQEKWPFSGMSLSPQQFSCCICICGLFLATLLIVCERK